MNAQMIFSTSKYLCLIVFLGLIGETLAQTSGINYQAVAVDMSTTEGFGRNIGGEVMANKDILVRFTLHEGAEDGPEVFSEEHNTKTDAFGIFRLVIGNGFNPAANLLESLDWLNKPYYLKVAIDFNDGAGFMVLGTEKIVVPPYSLDGDNQTLILSDNELSISGGNSIILEDLNDQNELISDISLSGSMLQIVDAGGIREINLEPAIGDDGTAIDELQTLEAGAEPGEISISERNTVFINVNDLDSDPTNENQVISAGNGIQVVQIGQEFTVSNTSPDQEVTLADGGSGNVIIGGSYPDFTVEVESNMLGAFSTTNNVTSNEPGDYVNDDFVFGSNSIEHGGNSDYYNRMFFDKSLGAFRAGSSSDASWNSGNIGEYSIALGVNNSASGYISRSFGHASGATGDLSITLGSFSSVESYAETGIGLFWTDYSPLSQTDFNENDRLLIVGNGTSYSNRSDALVILKNGNTSLNGSLTIDGDNVDGAGEPYTLPLQGGDANQILTAAGDGTTNWQDPTNDSPFNLNSGVISNKNPETEDFVFGSSSLEDLPGDADNSRIFFDKSKGALRAGQPYLSNWNDENRGYWSTAIGFNTNATSYYTLALGGPAAWAQGYGSISIANNSWSFGSYSISMGSFLNSRGINEIVLGKFNTDYVPSIESGNPGDAGLEDRLFVVGNGIGLSERSDALVILNNGNTSLNGSLTIDGDNVAGAGEPYTLPLQDGDANQILTTAGDGTTSWQDPTNDSPFNLNSGVISNKNPETEDFVFGSSSLDDIAGEDDDIRLFFDKNDGSFRVGHVFADRWDESFRGISSIAMGRNTMASGFYSIALGGPNTSATGYGAVTIGNVNLSQGYYSYTIGSFLRSQGVSEIVIGKFNSDYTPSVTNGNPEDAGLEDRLFVIGNGTGLSERSDALVMLNNGNTTLNGSLTIDGDNIAGAGQSYTLPTQDGLTNQILTTAGDGTTSWQDPTGDSPFNLNSGVISNKNPETEDFVFGSPSVANLPGSDDDNRVFFDKSEGAFGAGGVDDDHWDSQGEYSVAIGHNNRAQGRMSVALGSENNSNGAYSTTSGRGNYASSFSTALGNRVQAIGAYSTVIGYLSNSHGEHSLAIGNQTNSFSLAEMVVGLFNTDYTTSTDGEFVYDNNDRLFVIGNGIDDANRSDAFVMLKNGNTILNGSLTIDGDNLAGAGESYTLPLQDGGANQILTTAGDGTTSWQSATGDSPFNLEAGVIYNKNPDTEDFVFGSPQLDNDGDSDHFNRMLFDKSKGAFRAGGISGGTQWDDSNIGDFSIALGAEALATGSYSGAIGLNAHALSNGAMAFGMSIRSHGVNSFTIGSDLDANADNSIVIGNGLTSQSYGEISIGVYNTSYTSQSTLDYNSSDRLFVIGNGIDDANRSDALVILKNGNATLSGTLTELSDRRLKQNIFSIAGSLDKLVRLRGVNYKWNHIKPHDTKALQTGFIAQEVESLFPELVIEDSEGYKSVNYTGLIPHLLEAIKELKKENDKLKSKEQSQTSIITSLEKRLFAIEQLLELAGNNEFTDKRNTDE